jgi:chromosomal replication initiator protein
MCSMEKILNYMAVPGVPRVTNRDRSRLLRVFDPEIAIKTITDHFGLPMEELNVKCKKRDLVFPRQVIMYFLTEYTDLTFKQIGALFGRDHTTAIHSKDTMKNLISTDDKVRARIDELKRTIANNH